MVELCAGSGVLSAEAQRCGFQVFPIDHARNKFATKAAIFPLDLSSDFAPSLLEDMFTTMRPVWCHMGLPCGTCSRAREKPLPRELRCQGAPEPRPLRAAHALFGLDSLNGHEQTRVQAANRVYETAEHVLFCIFRLGLAVSIENPERSWLWALLAALVKRRQNAAYTAWYFSLDDITFDACCHGSSYPKTTRLKASQGVFLSLHARCDTSHSHAPWRIAKRDGQWHFDASSEAVYPALLVKRMVQCVVDTLPASLLTLSWKLLRAHTVQQGGLQHKSFPALIPEYASIEYLPEVPDSPPCKLLDSPWFAGEGGEGKDGVEAREDSETKRRRSFYKVGFFFDPQQHVLRALTLEHPTSQFNVVPDILRRNLFDVFTLGTSAVAKRRVEVLKELLEQCKNVQDEESALRQPMPAHVNQVTSGKQLVLFRRLLEETGFEDMTVCDMMEQGVSLTGSEPPSDLYWKKFQPASMTAQQLDYQAVWRRRAAMGKIPSEEELQQEADLETESLSEVKAGFLQGPFSEREVSEKLGTPNWSLNKRFVLYQGEERKIRVIDNFRDSGVNAAFSSSSYLALQDTDFIAGLLRFILMVCSVKTEVIVPLSNGSELRGKWHASFASEPKLLGRCVDLSKAYKQVAIAESSLQHGVLSYQTKQHGWRLYTTQSLPFGASASVFAFNKISRAIWHLLVHKLGIVASVFYDDYPCFEFEPLCSLTTSVLNKFFGILGWKHAVVGKKAKDFSPETIALGVQYELGELWAGSLTVRNKPGRLCRIKELAKEFKSAERGQASLAASLSGLLNFAGGFVLGHAFKPVTNALSKWSAGARPDRAVKARICDLLEVTLDDLAPRLLKITDNPSPVIIYTDGSFEDSVGRWGGLVIDATTGFRGVFSGRVPGCLLGHWLREVGSQVICEIETYAYLCIRWHLRGLLCDRNGICFIDNEASRMSLIKRSSASFAMFLLVSAISLTDAVVPFAGWMERVPSAANPADLPSRDPADELCHLVHARNYGDIELPPSLLSFLQSTAFQPRLAAAVRDTARSYTFPFDGLDDGGKDGPS